MSYEGRNEQPEFGSGSYGGSAQMPVPGQVPTADDDDDLSGAAEHATRNAGGSGDKDLFSSILGNFVGNKSKLANEDIDEQAAISQHKKFFGSSDDDDGEEASSGSMGSAAALQALKMFTGSSSSSSSGSSQSEFIGLAMSEASKLFEQQSSQGKVSSGSSKESAVQQAGEMALKMYLKSKSDASGGGSSGGSSSSGLLSLASKFM